MKADASTWVSQCRKNLKKFREQRQAMASDQQIAFIRSQYEVLSVLVKVADGRAQIRGSAYFSQKGST